MAKPKEFAPLRDTELPGLFRLADRGASRSKALYFFLLGVELIGISVAALAQVFGHQVAPGIASLLQLHVGASQLLGHKFTADDLTNQLPRYALPAAILAIAASVYLLRLIFRFDVFWRARRALAEATKELAWLYSMRAMGADLNALTPLNPDASSAAYNRLLEKLQTEGEKWNLGAPKADDVAKTLAMETLRKKLPPAQRDDYVTGRLQEQLTWYADNARHFQSRAVVLRVARIAAYALGGALIFFTGLGSNGLGAMTTIAGAVATWLVANHYDDLSQSYSAIARTLIQFKDRAINMDLTAHGGSTNPQSVWGQFVDEVETLLRGERQDWLRQSKDRSPEATHPGEAASPHR
jgi:hypothetical protein